MTGRDATENQVIRLARESQILHLAVHAFFSAPQKEFLFPVNLRAAHVYGHSHLRSDSGATVAARYPLLLSGIALSNANQSAANKVRESNDDGIMLASEVERRSKPSAAMPHLNLAECCCQQHILVSDMEIEKLLMIVSVT